MSRFIVGVTGGIGSGKTTVAHLFAQQGAAVVDTDDIAKSLTLPGASALLVLQQHFGARIIAADGGLDRTVLRSIVFADPDARHFLESVLHPLIRQAADKMCAQSTAPYVLLLIPLLFETGAYREQLSRVLLVDCKEEVQVQRVMQRSALSEEEVRAIMVTQATRAIRQAGSDDILLNEGESASDWSKLQAAVFALHDKYLCYANDLGIDKLKVRS